MSTLDAIFVFINKLAMFVNKTPGLTSIAWMTIIEADLYNTVAESHIIVARLCVNIIEANSMRIEANSPHFQNIYLFIVANAGLIVASV